MKNKRWKQIVGLVLAGILMVGSFAGCGGGGDTGGDNDGAGGGGTGDGTQVNSGEKAMGRYLEEDMTLPADMLSIYDMKKLEDGKIMIIGVGENKSCAWESSDGGASWEKTYEFPEELSEEKGYMDYGVLSEDGQAVCVFNNCEGASIKVICYLLDRQGNASQIPFELPEADGMETSTFQQNVSVDEDGEEDAESENNEGGQDDAAESENNEGGQDGAAESENNESGQDDAAALDSPKEHEVNNMIFDINFLGKDQVLIKDTQDVFYQVNVSDGSIKQKYEFDGNEDYHECHVAGKKIIIQTSTESLVFDSETGQQQAKEEALQNNASENGRFMAVDTLDGGESVYGLTQSGLYHYKFGGSVAEELIDGAMNSLGSPSFYPISLVMLDGQNLLVAANDSNASTATGIVLLKYTYSADTPAKPEKELRVYSLYENKEIRQSISRFQKEHTDIYVNFEVAMSGENGVTVSDALKTLTTEIMAGKGPDVLVLDGMPVKTYIEKGILQDMSDIIKGDNYFESILNAYKSEDGQLCAVPGRFLIPMIQAAGANHTAGESFDAFIERKDILAGIVPKNVIESFWYSCSASWQKEDGTLDESKINDFLTKLKNAYGEYDGGMDDETHMVMAEENSNMIEWRNISVTVSGFDLVSKKSKVSVGLFGGGEYDFLLAVNKKLENGDFDLMPGQAEHVFVPSMIMGISSKSTQPETAEQFVSYLFSEESQSFSQGGGLPVDKAAFKSTNDGHEYEGNSGDLVSVSGEDMDNLIDYKMEPRTEEEMKKLTDMAEVLTTPALGDEIIKEAVIEQGEKVLKGEISPQEATDAIMQKVNIYLAE